ncbi:tryptophan 7-halogenase [Pantoea ananatis]|uniref:tryptophan 7-halogenase n=1 Tax=Pantoea ananas TaxID=553 RepID=UPI0039B9969A
MQGEPVFLPQGGNTPYLDHIARHPLHSARRCLPRSMHTAVALDVQLDAQHRAALAALNDAPCGHWKACNPLHCHCRRWWRPGSRWCCAASRATGDWCRPDYAPRRTQWPTCAASMRACRCRIPPRPPTYYVASLPIALALPGFAQTNDAGLAGRAACRPGRRQEFLRAVAGTFKLSISFEHWRRPGDRFIHPFGTIGQGTWATPFHHFWLDSLRRGMPSDLGDFCLESIASRADRFSLETQPQVNYAYHFDAALYAKFLRKKAEGYGLRRVEGQIREVRQHAHDVPSDRAVAVQTEAVAVPSRTRPGGVGISPATGASRCSRPARRCRLAAERIPGVTAHTLSSKNDSANEKAVRRGRKGTGSRNRCGNAEPEGRGLRLGRAQRWPAAVRRWSCIPPPMAAVNNIRPTKLWCDTSTSAECVQIMDALGGAARTIALAGNPILAGYTASKLPWTCCRTRRRRQHDGGHRHRLRRARPGDEPGHLRHLVRLPPPVAGCR